MAQKVSNKKQLEWRKVTLERREEQGREKLCLMYFIPFLRKEIWNKYGKSSNRCLISLVGTWVSYYLYFFVLNIL